MDATKYSHPWTQDQALTDRLLKLVDDEDWDLFGIADVGPLNEKARPGRRPKDLWPTAKAVLMFAVGLADPFTRGWVQNGKSNVLVTEKYGPRINMTYLMTDAPLVTTIKEVPSRCGRCTACQKVCMSGAILGDYYFHRGSARPSST